MNTQGERMNESGQTIFFALAGVSPGIPQLEWVIGELRERLAGRPPVVTDISAAQAVREERDRR